MSLRIRRDHEQTRTPEPHPGLQGEGGACRRQGRSNAGSASGLTEHKLHFTALQWITLDLDRHNISRAVRVILDLASETRRACMGGRPRSTALRGYLAPPAPPAGSIFLWLPPRTQDEAASMSTARRLRLPQSAGTNCPCGDRVNFAKQHANHLRIVGGFRHSDDGSNSLERFAGAKGRSTMGH
jgi:hypothetical protein